MRKKDPRCELTPDVRAMFIVAVYDTKVGRQLMQFLPVGSEIGEKYRREKIRQLQVEGFDKEDVTAMPLRAFEGLINSMAALMPDFYKAIDRGNARKLKEVLDQGFPVNLVNPLTGGTALHSLAAGGARPAIRALLTFKNVNFISRDNKGRLPSEMAYLYGHDPALARLLGNKGRKQAAEKDIKLTRRPPPEAKP